MPYRTSQSVMQMSICCHAESFSSVADAPPRSTLSVASSAAACSSRELHAASSLALH